MNLKEKTQALDLLQKLQALGLSGVIDIELAIKNLESEIEKEYE